MSETTKKRSKILYIIVSVMLALIATGGIAVAFMLNYNTFAPSAPVVLDDGQNIYISTELNDNYKGYRFKFVDETAEQIYIDSEKNQLSAQELLENQIKLGKSYKISVCYIAENAGNNSEYSKSISWTFKTYLSMPYVAFDSLSSLLTWDEVDNADFYRIYINTEADFIETTETSYQLDNLEGGNKTINVVAYSNNENYITSNKSNSLEVRYIKYLQPFTSIDFDDDTYTITAKSTAEYQKVKIYLGENDYEANLFEVTNNGEEFIYSIDVTTIYNGEQSIGIAPCSIDEFNIYNGSVLYYQAPLI